MSWSFTRASTAYLSGALSSWNPSTGFTVLVWHKTTVGSDYHNILNLYGSGSERLRMYIDPTGPVHFADLRNGSAAGSTFQSASTSSGSWQCFIFRFDPGTDISKIFGTNANSAGATDTGYDWPVGDIDNIYIAGANAGSDTQSGKIGLVALYASALSDANCGLLVGGDHPSAIGTPAYLWDWVNSTSLTDSVAGATLTGSGTQSHDSGDNPTIDAPPAAGGIPKTSKLTLLGVG
jgi:hypothetical protein